MPRKKISTYKINKIRSLLLEGKTSKEVGALLKLSSATVSNYRAHFKKQGVNFSKQKKIPSVSSELKELEASKDVVQSKEDNEYVYLINGTKVVIASKPKSLQISQYKMIIEF